MARWKYSTSGDRDSVYGDLEKANLAGSGVAEELRNCVCDFIDTLPPSAREIIAVAEGVSDGPDPHLVIMVYGLPDPATWERAPYCDRESRIREAGRRMASTLARSKLAGSSPRFPAPDPGDPGTAL